MSDKAQGFTHDNKKNKTVDWYTPKWIFDALDLTFDLDPCQPKDKIPWVPANEHYWEEIDGLAQPWYGMVWLNPPYGDLTPNWLAKMHEHRQGIALVFARTDTKWYHDYCCKADAILFLKGRISFVDGLGVTAKGGAGAGSMLVAWGNKSVEALRRMSKKGHLVEMPVPFDDEL